MVSFCSNMSFREDRLYPRIDQVGLGLSGGVVKLPLFYHLLIRYFLANVKLFTRDAFKKKKYEVLNFIPYRLVLKCR